MLKLKLSPLCIAICLAGGITSPAFAESDEAKVDRLIQKVNARTAELEKEIRALKAQVSDLKRVNTKQDNRIQEVAAQKVSGPKPYGFDILKYGAMPVITAPYVGDVSDGFNLAPDGLTIILPYTNLDLGLLKQRQRMDQAFAKADGKVPHGLLQLSGRVETQLSGVRNTNGKTSSDIDVTDVELDFTSRVGEWVTAFAALKYDPNAPSTTQGPRVSNSRLYLGQGFITVGNLDKSPFYGTIGQRYVQFGQYSNPFVTGPLTRSLGRIKARQISVSYQHPGDSGVYATLFTFKGDSRANQNLNQLGGTVGYEFKQDKWNANVGVGYVSNIADGESSMQPTFAVNQQLVKRVPGIAVHGKVITGPYMFIAEYIGAKTPFDATNMRVNGVGAKPQALHVAGVYSYTGLWNRPSEIAIGYNRARDTQALGLPETRINVTHNMVVLKNTIFSLEYRRDKYYSAGDTASVQGVTYAPDKNTQFGGYTNTITAQLAYLF
ncbi:MAG: LbtU family siderophore porin [Gammaproteobacteria bacterium]